MTKILSIMNMMFDDQNSSISRQYLGEQIQHFLSQNRYSRLIKLFAMCSHCENCLTITELTDALTVFLWMESVAYNLGDICSLHQLAVLLRPSLSRDSANHSPLRCCHRAAHSGRSLVHFCLDRPQCALVPRGVVPDAHYAQGRDHRRRSASAFNGRVSPSDRFE